MTNHDELERAVERLTSDMAAPRTTTLGTVVVFSNDLRLILSANREMRAELNERADEGMLVLETLAKMTPQRAHRHVIEGLAIARKARSALTTQRQQNTPANGDSQ